MKFIVVSDIHGGIEGAQKIQQLFSTGDYKAILMCGDINYHGPRNDLFSDYQPKKVIDVFNSLSNHIIAVRGNCEAEVDQMVYNFSCLSESTTFYLGQRRVFMCHGHTYTPENLPPLNNGDIFLSGHTHIPTCDIKKGVYCLNPGSISLPKNNFPRSYAILDDDGFFVKDCNDTIIMQVMFNG